MKGQEFGPLDKVRIEAGVGHLIGYSCEVVSEVVAEGVASKRELEIFKVRLAEPENLRGQVFNCGPDEIEMIAATEIPRFLSANKVAP